MPAPPRTCISELVKVAEEEVVANTAPPDPAAMLSVNWLWSTVTREEASRCSAPPSSAAEFPRKPHLVRTRCCVGARECSMAPPLPTVAAFEVNWHSEQEKDAVSRRAAPPEAALLPRNVVRVKVNAVSNSAKTAPPECLCHQARREYSTRWPTNAGGLRVDGVGHNRWSNVRSGVVGEDGVSYSGGCGNVNEQRAAIALGLVADKERAVDGDGIVAGNDGAA